MKLLICEDEKEIREGLKETIDWASAGIGRVETAGNGREGMDMVRNFHPHIILTDIRMPVMDGLALCQHVYENHPEIRLIILSGYSDFEYARRAIRYRVENYFLKPVPIRELTDLVRSLTGEIREQSETPDSFGQTATGDGRSDPSAARVLTVQIQEYIENHYHEPINIDAVALALKKNASYISHIFKKETGRNCSGYLNEIRIRNSLKMLRTTDKTLDEIAGLTGFSNSAYFITVFRKVMNITPSKYRASGCKESLTGPSGPAAS